MRYLLIALGIEPCALCGMFNGHQQGCPYGDRRQS